MTTQQDSTSETGISHDTPRGNQTVSRAIERKANAALDMALGGFDWEDIASALGYPTPRAAMVATEQALERDLRTEESKKHMRQLHRKRLERLLRGVWVKAINPEDPDHLSAVDRARKIIEDQRKLHALDAPTELVVSTPTAAELERWVEKVNSARLDRPEEGDIFNPEMVPGEVLEVSTGKTEDNAVSD